MALNPSVRRLLFRTVALAGAGATFGLSAFWAFELAASWRESSGPPKSTAAEPSLAVAAQSSARPVPSSRAAAPDMRALIQAAVERARVNDAADLERYLDELEAQARRNGRVTALEVAPGLSLILAKGTPEQAKQFSERMVALQTELGEPAPVQRTDQPLARKDLDQLENRIEAAAGEEKQALVRTYLDAIAGLSPDDKAERAMKLNALVGRVEEPADAATIDSLWRGIERAPDETERQDLIQEYILLVQGLPDEDERARRFQELNRRFGRRSAE